MFALVKMGFSCLTWTAWACSIILGQAGERPLDLHDDSIAELKSIRECARTHSHSESDLAELSDTIGPRLTGSRQARIASDWAIRRMKAIGLQNAHLESFAVSHGWQRGYARAELVKPIQLALNISSYGWVGSTRSRGETADVVLVNADAIPDEIKSKSSTWFRKVLLVAPISSIHVNPIRSYSQLSTLVLEASKAGAFAVIYRDNRPGSMLIHTEPVAFGDAVFPIPVVDIASEHQQLLIRQLLAGNKVRIHIDVQNRITTHPILSANVVGEIAGAKKPDEIIVVGAHLDSWDLGTGATDDGFGVASVLAAADAIISSGARPARTIRFVLFSGEEQGLLGSLAYVKKHASETSNTVCAFALDWGNGPIVSLPLAGHSELSIPFKHLSQLLGDLGPLETPQTYLSYTDAYSFTLAGIPGIAPYQDSPEYATIAHSPADTLDKVDPNVLKRNATLLALCSFWIANHPTRLGTWFTPETAKQILTRDNQRRMLELLGLWPFGTGN